MRAFALLLWDARQFSTFLKMKVLFTFVSAVPVYLQIPSVLLFKLLILSIPARTGHIIVDCRILDTHKVAYPHVLYS